MTTPVEIVPGLLVGGDRPPLLIAGPCVIEGEQTIEIAERIAAEKTEIDQPGELLERQSGTGSFCQAAGEAP